jgi:hypothetical protein
MLVYCVKLELNSPFHEVIDEIADWMAEKLKTPAHKLKLTENGGEFSKDRQRLRTIRAADDFPLFQSITFTQPDSRIDGRRWVTEIGIKQSSSASPTEFSILMETEEHSIRVNGAVIPTRPGIVPNLMQRCQPTEAMPDKDIALLDEHNARDMLSLINSPDRAYPIVIISPTQEGEYLIAPKDLIFQLCGLAEVVQIPTTANTYRIADIMGSEFTAWRGAIRIIYPPGSNARQNGLPYVWLIKADEIEQLRERLKGEEKGHYIEREILSIITHRTNVPNSWKHISRAMVIEHQRNLRMRHLSAAYDRLGATSQEQQEYVNLLKEVETEQQAQIDGLKTEREALLMKILELEEQIDNLKHQNESLRVSLDYNRANARPAAELDPAVALRCLRLRNADTPRGKAATPHDVLLLCEALFGDRLLFLDSARKSARESDGFRFTPDLLDLMLKLANEYWQAMCDERGDGEARQIFGDKNFSSRESEKVENNRAARAARTFTYKGEPVCMWRHLRIGVADNASDTIRVHFHWDHESRRIVIGHMGPHLPFG